jgi:sugar phosphate permease
MKPTRQRAILVGILLFTLLVAYLDRVNVSVLLADKALLADMGIAGKPIEMGKLMTYFLIAYGVANVALSPLGDIWGPRLAMSLSIFLWTLSVMLGGLATTFTTSWSPASSSASAKGCTGRCRVRSSKLVSAQERGRPTPSGLSA